MQDSEWNPKTEKEHEGKTEEKAFLVNKNASILI